MILPTKHISRERALLTVGARLLARLDFPKTVSALWEEVSKPNTPGDKKKPALRYDAFVLTLDLLYMLGAVHLQNGLLRRNKRP